MSGHLPHREPFTVCVSTEVEHPYPLRDEREEPKKEEAIKESDNTQKAVKKLKANLEKTTLGDISELADLKSKMENASK